MSVTETARKLPYKARAVCLLLGAISTSAWAAQGSLLSSPFSTLPKEAVQATESEPRQPDVIRAWNQLSESTRAKVLVQLEILDHAPRIALLKTVPDLKEFPETELQSLIAQLEQGPLRFIANANLLECQCISPASSASPVFVNRNVYSIYMCVGSVPEQQLDQFSRSICVSKCARYGGWRGKTAYVPNDSLCQGK